MEVVVVVVVVNVVVVVVAGAAEVVEVVVVVSVSEVSGEEEVVGAAEVDVEVAVVIAVAGEAGRSCVSLVVVASDGAAVAVTASAVVGVASEPPSPLSLSSDEHAAANKIAATHTARMFLKISFLVNFMYCARFLVFCIGNIDFHHEKTNQCQRLLLHAQEHSTLGSRLAILSRQLVVFRQSTSAISSLPCFRVEHQSLGQGSRVDYCQAAHGSG